MRSITVRRVDYPATTEDAGYRMVLTVTAANDTVSEIFVKQRFGTPDEPNDVFVAIASPVQLEDFPADEPGEEHSFFRVSEIDLVAENAATIDDYFDQIVAEIRLLIANLNSLDSAAVPNTTITITEDTVTIV